MLNTAEYFRYHPPKTPERIALHEQVNGYSLNACIGLIEARDQSEVDAICDGLLNLVSAVCRSKVCTSWAINSIQIIKTQAGVATHVLDEDRLQKILMQVQQVRMFLNQGITLDEIEDMKIVSQLPTITKHAN